jgi:ketosteroid isomerase-like protein
MGRGFQQTGRRRAFLALFEARAVLRLEPETVRGRDGVAAYFKGLPRWRTSTVQFSDVVFEQVGPDLVKVAGTASFDVDQGAIKLSLKITWVIAREDGDWKIVSHHVSSKAPLI